MRKLKRILWSIPGLVTLAVGIYMIVALVQQRGSMEDATAHVKSFHYHEGYSDDIHPDLEFIYNGDTVLRRLGEYDTHPLIVGDKVIVTFPKGDPQSAEIKSIEWFLPAFVTFIGVWWIVTMLFIVVLERAGAHTPSGNVNVTRRTQLGALLLFSSLAILLCWLAYYFTKAKLTDSDNETEWGGLVVLWIMAFLFVSICSLNWYGYFTKGKSIDKK